MAIKIKFDASHNPEPPTIILAKRSGHKLGMLNAKSIEVRDAMNDASEISFTVHKNIDGEICHLWNEIKNFRLVFCPEWNMWFEIVVELNESNDSVKTITGTQLGIAELSQIMLYNVQINTDLDMGREEYDEEDPTVLYNPSNTDASILHRITEKAPHYSIRHVDSSLESLSRILEFEFDDTSIYDAFQEIAEQVGCIFVLHSDSDSDGNILREFSVYDLESNCIDCGHRGEFTSVCPKCASTNINEGYGEDTTIFVTSDELANEIQLSSNTDEVKNCFKLLAGDDDMTAAVRNCNPNGTDYIWYISDDVKNEMSEELANLINSYDERYAYYQNDYVLPIDDEDISEYNELVSKYQEFSSEYDLFDFDFKQIGSDEVELKGYPALMSSYYDTVDLSLFLTSSLMPSADLEETNAQQEAETLEDKLTEVAVTNIGVASLSTVNSSILKMAKVIIDNRYNVEIDEDTVATLDKAEDSDTEKIWTGKLVVSHSSYDEEDLSEMEDEEAEKYAAITDEIVVRVTGDYETFIQQSIEKTLNEDDVEDMSISGLFKKELIVEESVVDGNVVKTFSGEFYDELKKYCLNRLTSFLDACAACIEILEGSEGDSWAEEDAYDEFSSNYYDKQDAIIAEIAIRDEELKIIETTQNIILRIRDSIHNELNFENYIINLGNIEESASEEEEESVLEEEEETNPDDEEIDPDYGDEEVETDDEDKEADSVSDGEKLWIEFCSYRRESTYSNENYISDGLDNIKLFERATQFIEVAANEIRKSAELQHNISTTLMNLLVIDKFKPLVNSFETGNWLRIMVDDEIFKLRLIEYTINYDDMNNISVEFSDVTKNLSTEKKIQDVLSQASSIATSYSYIQKQVSKTSETIDGTINNWLETGLDTTNIKIVSGADNQTQVWDENGMLFREYNSLTGEYEPTQLRIINSTIAITDDNWDTLKMAIGNMYYTDPLTKEVKESYGINAETIVGKLFIGENLILSNDGGTLTFDSEGLIATGGNGTNRVTISPDSSSSFSIQKKDNDAWENVLCYSNGSLVITGKIIATEFELIDGATIESGSVNGLHTVATSGSYTDLLNQPIISTSVQIDDSNAVSSSAVYDYVNDYALRKTQTDNAGKFMCVDDNGNISFVDADTFRQLLGI